MDYDKLKTLMEANREKLAVQDKPEVKEFRRPDSMPDWNGLDYTTEERIAA